MSVEFTRNLLRIAVAQVCQNLGWNAVQMTPMELLTDVLERYILEIGKQTHTYSEQFGRTAPNLDDVGLAFQEMGISLSELEEYVTFVDPLPFALDVPRFPAPKETLLHFPCPNSKELQNREEHIHEHLPPMHPEWDEEIVPAVAPTTVASQLPEKTIVSLLPSLATPAPRDALQKLSTSEITTGEKRPAEDNLDGGPSAKQQRLLPDEAAPSQYMMKNVHMSNSGIPSGATGILADACTPPPPTPQTPKALMLDHDLEPRTPLIPVPFKPVVPIGTSDIKSKVSEKKVDILKKVRKDGISIQKSPKTTKGLLKTSKGSNLSKLQTTPSSLPKGMPKIPKIKRKEGKDGKSPKSAKSPKSSSKVKKIKIPKVKSSKPVAKSSNITEPAVKVEQLEATVKIPPEVDESVLSYPPSEDTVIKLSPKPTEEPASKVEPTVKESPSELPLVSQSPVHVKSPPRGRSPAKSRSPGRRKSPGHGRSPGRGRSPGKARSPRRSGRSRLEELLVQKSEKDEQFDRSEPEDNIVKQSSRPTYALDSSMDDTYKKDVTLDSSIDVFSPPSPSLASPMPQEAPPAPLPASTTVPSTPQVEPPPPAVAPSPIGARSKSDIARDKMCRLASYDDTIESVLQQTANLVPQDESLMSDELSAPKPSPMPETPHRTKTKKESKTSQDPAALPSFDLSPIKDSPKLSQSLLQHSVFDFDDMSNESFPSPSVKEKHKRNKKSKLKAKLLESVSLPAPVESETVKDIEVVLGTPHHDDPKVILDKITPSDVDKFSFPSPDKSTSAAVKEEAEEKPIIQPIRIDISQPKLTIKFGDSEKKVEKESKKEKKKKKNKDKDKDKNKDKKNKDKKKEKKDKQKKEKTDKGEKTVTGGQGFPKLTLKIGGLKTTPSIAKFEESREPAKAKPESLKLVIKPLRGECSSKTKKSKHQPQPPSPPPSPHPSPPPPPSPVPVEPSPEPSPIPSPTPSPIPEEEHIPSPIPSPAESLQSPSPIHVESPKVQSVSSSPVNSPVHASASMQSPMPVIKQNSPMEIVPDFTFSPSPSPPPHVEIPMSRSPTPSPSPSPAPFIREIDKEPSVITIDDQDDDGDEDLSETTSARAIIAETIGIIKDENGQTIWICPACKMQDDGSPMIGCDKCDDWYHWPCVGIKKEPPEEQQWFCPRCRIIASKGFDKKQKPIKAKPRRKSKKK